MVIHRGALQVRFIGQCHRSKFKVTGGNVPFSAERMKVKLEKPVLAMWRKSRPDLETAYK